MRSLTLAALCSSLPKREEFAKSLFHCESTAIDTSHFLPTWPIITPQLRFFRNLELTLNRQHLRISSDASTHGSNSFTNQYSSLSDRFYFQGVRRWPATHQRQPIHRPGEMALQQPERHPKPHRLAILEKGVPPKRSKSWQPMLTEQAPLLL